VPALRRRARGDGPMSTAVGPQPAACSRGSFRFEPWLVVAIVVVDQLAKAAIRAYVPLHDSITVIKGFLNITHVRNTGAAFGILNDVDLPYKQAIVALFAVGALVGISAFAWRLARHELTARLGLALILGGALGNLVDRVTAGAVVDFVDVVFGTWHFWAFNVADSAITLGVGAMFLDMFGIGRHVSSTL
jgi:signal peptidase II